jgi:hypothetical protein
LANRQTPSNIIRPSPGLFTNGRIRGVCLEGNDFGILWPQMVALFVLGLVITIISSLRFKKRLG